MNITEAVPKNITVPEDIAQDYNPIHYDGYIQGYQEGFEYALEAFQDMILVILIVSVLFWVTRIVINRLDVDTTVDMTFAEWHVDNTVLKEIAYSVYYTIILAVSGFMMYYLVI